MLRLRAVAPQAVDAMGGDPMAIARAGRAAKVRHMWEVLMKSGGDDYILEHTNNVIILDAKDAHKLRRDHDDRKDAGATGVGQQLSVYVDESIVAAELNARRELVKLQFYELFGEKIDEFKIIISRGQYKKHHPFVPESAPSYEEHTHPVPLDAAERAEVERRLAAVDDDALRRVAGRAMVADLEWKKGLDARG